MPAPIVLSTLTPETKKVLNPPTGQPVIATKAELRDGSRVAEPVAPGTIDWASRLRKVGSGTPDSSFDPETDIVYIGAFLIPKFSNGTTSTAIKDYIGYKPPESGGRNGPNGSIFLGGDGAGGGGWVGEVRIPDFSGTAAITDYTQLPQTTVLQNFVSVIAKAPIQDSGAADAVSTPSAFQFVGDTLYMSFYAFYEANADNAANLLVCQDAKDLANSSYIGFLSHPGNNRDFKYSLEIPAAKQAQFNNATHLTGVWASHSIIGRTSYGPSLYGYSPASIQPGATSFAIDEHSFYGAASPVEFWSYNGEELLHWYEDQLAIGRNTLGAYLAQEPAARVSDPTTLPLPSASLHPSSGHDTHIACAFIPPGTDTVVFIGTAEGHRFGSLYKQHFWERLNGPGGWHPTSVTDYANFFWTLNTNDVANAVSPSDPGIIKAGIFDNDRWRIEASAGVNGTITSGTFDAATGRLYVCHSGIPFNEFENNQKIISVYQVGGGV